MGGGGGGVQEYIHVHWSIKVKVTTKKKMNRVGKASSIMTMMVCVLMNTLVMKSRERHRGSKGA